MKNTALLFFLLSCLACSSPTSKCTLGAPTAIFNQELQQVTKHHFTVHGQDGTENVEFNNGRSLEVLQKGCETVSQEFRFTIPGKASDTGAPFWIGQAAESFHFLALLADQYLIYHQYAQVLEQNAADLRLKQIYKIKKYNLESIFSSCFAEKTVFLTIFTNFNCNPV